MRVPDVECAGRKIGHCRVAGLLKGNWLNSARTSCIEATGLRAIRQFHRLLACRLLACRSRRRRVDGSRCLLRTRHLGNRGAADGGKCDQHQQRSERGGLKLAQGKGLYREHEAGGKSNIEGLSVVIVEPSAVP